MKATTQTQSVGLKNRSELLGTGSEANGGRPPVVPAPQLQFRLVSAKAPLKRAHPYRLREGDIVLFNNRICPVLRITDCCAIITVAQSAREFTTLFGKCVRIKPKPKLVRISSNSEIPILKRRGQGGRR